LHSCSETTVAELLKWVFSAPESTGRANTKLENIRALSSVGSEHLPYKQGVAGSNPAGPTKPSSNLEGFLIFALKPLDVGI
jgi:hypothetical protein